MLDAKEAHAKSETNRDMKRIKEEAYIFDKIDAAIEDGRFYICCDIPHAEIITKLKALGYNVYITVDGIEVISW